MYNKEAQRRQGVSEFWRALSFSLPIYRRRCGLNSWRGERGEISLREGEMHGNFHLSVGNCAATLVTRKRPPSQRPLLRMHARFRYVRNCCCKNFSVLFIIRTLGLGSLIQTLATLTISSSQTRKKFGIQDAAFPCAEENGIENLQSKNLFLVVYRYTYIQINS